MGMIWDGQQHADLVAEEARVKGLLAEASLRMHDDHASDKPWDEKRLADYTAAGIRHAQLTRELETVRGERRGLELLEPRAVKKSEASAFTRWLRRGVKGLEASERALLVDPEPDDEAQGQGIRIVSGASRPLLATSPTDASGQEAVQETVVPNFVDALSYYGGVAKFAYKFQTSTGNNWKFPQVDAASQKGRIDGQTGAPAFPMTALDLPNISPANRGVIFTAHRSNSRWIKITREMLTDAVMDIESYAQLQALRRLGRIWNEAFTTGVAGVSTVGVVSSAAAGITAASQTAITWQELINLQGTINYAYRHADEAEGEFGLRARMGGKVGYMVSDSGEQAMKRLADSDQRPVWLPSLTEGRPNMFGGYPYVVNGDMAALAAGSVSFLFGNFSYYGIRTVGAVEFHRFWDTNTAEDGEIWCMAYARRDGRPIGALTAASTTEAWAKLTQAA